MIIKDMFYTVIGWLNFPSRSTALGQTNLRHMDNGILQCAQYILSLSQDKAELSEVNTMVQNVTLDTTSGILTVTLKNGTVTTYDLAIEKVVINFDIDDKNQLTLTLADGTKKVIDLTRFVYTVASTATVAMQINNRVITANVVDGSITLDKLETSVIQTLRQYMLDAQAADVSAGQHQTAAQSWATGDTGSREGEESDNSKYYSEQSKMQAERAGLYADLILPVFTLDWASGHLYCEQGNSVILYVSNNHVIAEVA